MNTDTNAPDLFQKFFQNTAVEDFWQRSSVVVHVLLIAVFALLIHFIIILIHRLSEWLITHNHSKKTGLGYVTEKPKFVTLTQLVVSALTFAIYFFAVGLVLVSVFHFNDTVLKTYLSSAAVIGLALSFGLQGLVQDVVTGLTLIFSNAIDVGDIVDLSGTIGRVQQIGLRFTKVINFYNQEIFVPNRNIANVARFPRGGVYAYADIQIAQQADQQKAEQLISDVARGVWKQFGAIILAEPELGTIESTDPAGWNFLRIQFKIWPGQTLIETVFRPQMVNAMKQLDPNYADWMVPVTYRAITRARDKSV
jgi:moderate conductance mechanosensitive channel